ncbi:MAG: hypothetical protein CMQ53_00385 [Gammaproteobacteria bacterium]|nr:hypothetical protein [Gammaproteobacteria bacterium]
MTRLKFNSNKALVKLAKDTIKASNFKVAYRDKYTTDKSFYLVKDDGIYLMNCYKDNPNKSNTVIYASGFNPKYNKDVWEDSYLVSRDDFAFNLHLEDDQLERIANGGSIEVGLSEDEYSVRA